MQRGSVALVPMWLYDNLNILIESRQETQQALDRELPELTPQHLGNVRLPHPEQFGGFPLF
jgi:hypothetical protein